ncbi:hypothetical protein ACLB2K_017147 [Fragaria x ananassa]
MWSLPRIVVMHHICQNFLDTVELLAPELGASEEIFHFLAAQAELLLYLMISAHKSLPPSVCFLVLKTSAASLKVLSDFQPLVTGSGGSRMSASVTMAYSLSNSSDIMEKPKQIWGLGSAVITAMVQSLGDSSACSDIVENVLPYFFSEKAYIISYYLSAPEFPSDDHDKKRPRAQQRQTSLTELKETEHTLMLMCVLAKHWNSWVKAMKELDSQLREKSIHLLAFISRGTQRLGETAR